MSFDVSNTPDGYEIDDSGSFTFNTKCGVRTSPDMSVTPVTYYQIGQTLYYARKIKNGNHFWLSYIGASGNWAFVPYANTDTGVVFGTDSDNTNPIKTVDGGSTGGSSSEKGGEIGSLYGEAAAAIAEQTTPDGTRMESHGSFTFSENAYGRIGTKMADAKTDHFVVGNTLYYQAKIKDDGRFWLEYSDGDGVSYVPYARIDPFRYIGQDSLQSDPVIPEGSSTGGSETGGGSTTGRPQGGEDTGYPSLSGATSFASVEGYEYPASGWVQLKSGAQERTTPDFYNGVKAGKHYAGSTKLKYVAKVNGSGRMWVKLASNGNYLPIGQMGTLTNVTKLSGSGRYEEVGYVTDQNTSQPWEYVDPYSKTFGGTSSKGAALHAHAQEWENNFAIVNEQPSTSFTPSDSELSEMQRVQNEIQQNASDDDIIITYITDTHVDSYQSPATAAALRGIEVASYYAKNFGSDLIVHGGDLEDGNSSKQLSMIDMERSVDAIKTAQRPYIILQGNHDDNSGYTRDIAGYQTDQIIGNSEAASIKYSPYFNKATGSDNPNNATFGTYDVPDSNVTIMVLDGFDQPDVETDVSQLKEKTSGTHFSSFRHGYTRYSAEQYAWAQRTMSSLAVQGRQVLVMNHISLRGVTGWQDTELSRFEVLNDLSGLSEAMYNNVITPYKNNIIGYIAGHTHEDDQAYSGGVQFVTTTCANSGRGKGATTRNSPDNFAFDVLQISSKNRSVIRHRYGFGKNDESGSLLKSWNW